MITFAAGNSTAAGLSRSTTRVGRRGGPSLMSSSTPPCETLPGCLRRHRRGRGAGLAVGLAGRPGVGRPAPRASGRAVRPRRGGPGAVDLRRHPRRGRARTPRRCSAALAVLGLGRGADGRRRGTAVDGSGHRGGDVRRVGRDVVGAHRRPDGRPPGRRRHRRGPASCCRRCADATPPRWTPRA